MKLVPNRCKDHLAIVRHAPESCRCAKLGLNFADRTGVLALRETVIFNCTGLGAAALFEDADLVPAKGQLVYLPPDPDVDYMTFGGGFSGDNGFFHMFSRGEVVVLGGIFKLGDSTRNVEVDQTERIVQEHRKLFESFG